MQLDLNTLFVVTIYVEALLGLLLLFVWAQNPEIRAVAWWGSAHLLRAGSAALFGAYGSAYDVLSIDLANAILFCAYAVTWTGARVFDGRKPWPLMMVGGAALWLVAVRVPALADSSEARLLLTSGIVAGYTWMTAFEFWRGREEALVSRWPAIFLLAAHGALFLLRAPLGTILSRLPESLARDSVWLTLMSVEALLFTIAISFILLAMAKERAELRHRTDAMIDPLTGLANRRAFLESNLERVKRTQPRPGAVLLMDLDRFKSINDCYGHALGDRVLQIFAATANECLRPFDIAARLGGEEFAVVLYDTEPEKALATAERLRSTFARAAASVDGNAVAATISIGISLCEAGPVDLAGMLAQADLALYRAKERGRNRVEIASLEPYLARGDVNPAATAQNVA